MNQILNKKENMENLLQNFRTTANMTEEIEAGVGKKAETETQKVVNKVYFPHMRWKTTQVKNGLHLMNKGSFQKENVTKFQVGELSVPKHRPRNNQTVIGGNEHYDTTIVLET